MQWLTRYSSRTLSWVAAGGLLVGGCTLAYALATYSAQLPSVITDYAGADAVTLPLFTFVRQSIAAVMFIFSGVAAWWMPLGCTYGALLLVDEKHLFSRLRLAGIGLAFAATALWATWYGIAGSTAIEPGGMLGTGILRLFLYLVDPLPAFVLACALSACALVCLLQWSGLALCVAVMRTLNYYLGITRSIKAFFRMLGMWVRYLFSGVSPDQKPARQDDIAKILADLIREEEEAQLTEVDYRALEELERTVEQVHATQRASECECVHEPHEEVVELVWAEEKREFQEDSQGSEESEEVRYTLPGVDLLEVASSPHEGATARAEDRAHALEEKLKRFAIEGRVTAITRGPVVTTFEYEPASHIKVSRILALEDDLALALQAHSVRILAPIPGRNTVGFEVANEQRDIVYFSDIARQGVLQTKKRELPLILGASVRGEPVVSDLAQMPHLLIAGSTGSGKSVAMHSLIMSLLCSARPDDVKMLLIDPKRLEYSRYADLPHLLFPVIVEPSKVVSHLSWAVREMEERYNRLAQAGVRSIVDYHQRYGIADMPYLVIVIDELADLMMTAGRDVESLLARLAQMARAAGIHMIIATQRPSVDVITGLIKVNIPTRIACKVISKIDSRTILDSMGAERLLGKGDMLMLESSGVLSRVHGAYVREEEIARVVAAIKAQRAPAYQHLDLALERELQSDEIDALYDAVVDYLQGKDAVSISQIQRQFRIGYNRSARLVECLEGRGILSGPDQGKMRKVLR